MNNGRYDLHIVEGDLKQGPAFQWKLERPNGERIESSIFVNKAKALSNCVDELGDEILVSELKFFNLTFGQISLIRAAARHRVPIRKSGGAM